MKFIPFSICIALFSLITGLSCTKNDGPPILSKPQVKKADQWGKEGTLLKVSATITSNTGETDQWGWTTYEYDKNFNLVKTTDSVQQLTRDGYIIEGKNAEKRTERQFQYSNNTLVKVVYVDSLYPLTTINYNPEGQLVSAINSQKNFSFQYSNNGDTVNDTIVYSNGIKQITILNKYFFQNGNLLKSQQFDITGGIFRQTVNIEYGGYDQKNTPLKAITQSSIVRLFFTIETEAWKNNVISFNYNDVLNGTQATRTFAYEYNAAGYPVKSTWSDTFGGATQITGTKYYYYTNP